MNSVVGTASRFVDILERGVFGMEFGVWRLVWEEELDCKSRISSEDEGVC